MFVWKQNGFYQAIWNPVLNNISDYMESREGCLSLPQIIVNIERATSSVLTGIGFNNKPLKFIGDATTTRIWQHEIDHLNGKLIIDSMSINDETLNSYKLNMLKIGYDLKNKNNNF